MKFLFWSSLSLIFFAYAGYPIWLYFRARFRPRPVRRASIFPSVSILLAVHNEEKYLPAKLHNLAALDYPADHVEVIVVSDGSRDRTNEILAVWENPRRRTVFLPDHRGKANALNHGVAEAKGEIIIFTDARQTIASDALKNLVTNFADHTVGCVSGELILPGQDSGETLEGVGLYWRLEKKIRQWESAASSVVGATGALYAARRGLLVPLPPGTILDDVYIPLEIARRGYRVVFEPRALVWESLRSSTRQEFRRKVRTLTGNYQLLQLQPWLLTRGNPMRFQFIGHKALRLLAPFMLLTVLVSALLLQGSTYRLAAVLQLAFYAIGVLPFLRPKSHPFGHLPDAVFAFLLLNAAAVMALVNFLTGRKQVWVR
jgi:poly-beta-1,6-N-acetyl-D-glucosamine synthase